ncbi:S8 family serine peptidase [Streptomyces sp. P1-3]|uniref:S8 family serine peptidase n=1 Tax=Streptomyces sp. P1-3 TaxID=3421658 RepID=UPI003D36F878
MPREYRPMWRGAKRALAVLGATLVVVGGVTPEAAADDFRSHQWYLDGMKAPAMWKVSQGRGVIVGVVDTGINASLPELQGRVLPGKEVSNAPTGSIRDGDGHGTNIAALIAGTGAKGGIQGLVPEAKILPVKAVMNRVEDSADGILSRAIRYAADHDAKVINVSLGPEGIPEYYEKTQQAVNYALKEGSLIFAAAGNGGEKGNHPNFPASLPGVVGVAAIDRSATATKFSNHGDQVALAAPGEDIPWRCPEMTGRCNSWGTSQASALASASAALIWAKHPDWTNYQVLRVMLQTAGAADGKVPSEYVGYGTIRPRKVLLDGEGNPGRPDVNPLLAREGATEPKPSASASTSPSAKPNSPAPSDKPSDDKAVVESESDHDDSNNTVWIGAGAVVAVLAAVGVAVVVRRRGKGA